MTDRTTDDGDLGLPSLGDTDTEELDGVENDVPIDVSIVDDGGDPYDDSYADDVPLDVEIQTDHQEPTVIGDVALGVEGVQADVGIDIEEGGVSMIDEGRGHAEEGLDFAGDDELGIDPIPTEVDDGGVDGLDDPQELHIEEADFPPLDGEEEDDDCEELDLGIELEPPLVSDDDRSMVDDEPA